MKIEPNRLEIFLTKIAFSLCGKSVYQGFADCLPLNGNERVLDFGCGMGTVAYYAAKRLPNGHLTCLDISERWMNICRKTLRSFGNIIFMQCESPVFMKGSFDVVYCHFVLHDLSENELERVIPEIAKSLRSGGVFVFREPLNELGKLNIVKRLVEQNRLFPKNSRITDIPVMGNAVESVYVKQ